FRGGNRDERPGTYD
ncbi:unnamed protein product, partial [Didymodactylos carnosus]